MTKEESHKNIIPTSFPAYKGGRRRRSGTTPGPNFVAESSQKKPVGAVVQRIEISFVAGATTKRSRGEKRQRRRSFAFIDSGSLDAVTQRLTRRVNGSFDDFSPFPASGQAMPLLISAKSFRRLIKVQNSNFFVLGLDIRKAE